MKLAYLAAAACLTFAGIARADAPDIVSSDGKYLGKLSSNKFDPDSTSNPYGRYGSKYSPDSINNPYGEYGSKYSNESVHNPYATNAPHLESSDGE